MIMEYTCDEYCDMLLTHGACTVIVELVLLHGNTGYAILIYVIHMLMPFDDWSSVSARQQRNSYDTCECLRIFVVYLSPSR
jgi:hypothetical protein